MGLSLEVAAYVAAASALLSAIAALWWGKQFAAAKNAQVETLRQQLDMMRLMTSPLLLEQFVATKRLSEGVIDGLQRQLEGASQEVNLHVAKIQELETQGATRSEEIARLANEKRTIEEQAATLAGQVKRLRQQPVRLLQPHVFEQVASSSAALANSLTVSPTYAIPTREEFEESMRRIGPSKEFVDRLVEVLGVKPNFGDSKELIEKMQDLGVVFPAADSKERK